MTGLQEEAADNVLHQHRVDFHPDQRLEQENFTFKVKPSQGGCLQRQAEEGTKIMLEIQNRNRMARGMKVEEREGVTRTIVMNSRREFHQPLGGVETRTAYIS